MTTASRSSSASLRSFGSGKTGFELVLTYLKAGDQRKRRLKSLFQAPVSACLRGS